MEGTPIHQVGLKRGPHWDCSDPLSDPVCGTSEFGLTHQSITEGPLIWVHLGRFCVQPGTVCLYPLNRFGLVGIWYVHGASWIHPTQKCTSPYTVLNFSENFLFRST